MSITYVITQTFKIGNNTTAYSKTITCDGGYTYDGTLAANQTNALIACAIDVSQLQALYIYADADVTLKTNSSGAPVDTLSIDGGNPLVWVKDSGVTCPLTADVTALYATNTTALTAFKIFAAIDLTV